MESNQVNVAVVGASGYSGFNLLRFLLAHPRAEVVGVTSRQYAGTVLAEVFPRFRGDAVADRLAFSEATAEAVIGTGASFVFLALPHGLAAEFAVPFLDAGLRVIDLSADFRLNDAAVFEEFYGGAHPAPALLDEAVYGLPEVYAEEVAGARLVASPGCYPTSILVPLLPVLRAGLIDPATIHLASMSGVSGAGKSVKADYLFAECNESVRPYGVPKHRHLSEIEQELALAAGRPVAISFTPHLVPVTAGICSTTYAAAVDGADAAALTACYREAYAGKRFVRLLGEGGFPDTKHVVGTNYVDVGWAHDPRTGRFVLMSAEDNLGKGAATQAVQAFNLMAGLPEETGLTVI